MSGANLVVQCFIKRDTLEGLCDSLLKLQGHQSLDLVFWLDHPRGSRKEEEFTTAQAGVVEFLKSFTERHHGEFQSIEIHRNQTNLGTCGTCRAALDYAFTRSEFGIFVEDDVVFSRDALIWFAAVHRLGLLARERYWAIAGESIFFNAGVHRIDAEFIAGEREIARRDGLVNCYTSHNFMPSTAFATTRARWAEWGATRGQLRGDGDVNDRCKSEGRYCVFPVVPRLKDVGMLHDLGFSVLIHTRQGVSEIKQTYLLAEDLLPPGRLPSMVPQLYAGDAGALFSRTTLLVQAPG